MQNEGRLEELARTGDVMALAAYLDREKNRFVSCANRRLNNQADAEDAFSMFCVECILKFRPGWFDTFDRIDKLLFAILHTKVSKVLKFRNHSNVSGSEVDLTNKEAPLPSTPNDVDELVDRAVDRLPPEQGACVRLQLEGLSYDQIAAAVKESPKTVRSRLARGKESLRIRLQPYFDSHFRQTTYKKESS